MSKNMSLKLTRYCFVFTARLNDDNIECLSIHVGRQRQKWNKIFNLGSALIGLTGIELGPGGFIASGPHESRSQNMWTGLGYISQLARHFQTPI